MKKPEQRTEKFSLEELMKVKSLKQTWGKYSGITFNGVLKVLLFG